MNSSLRPNVEKMVKNFTIWAIILLGMAFSQSAEAQWCNPSFYYGPMGTNQFIIYNSNGDEILNYYGYSDYGQFSGETCTLVAGETYTFYWQGGDYYGYWYYYGYDWAFYPQYVSINLDSDNDYSFDLSSEQVWFSGGYDYSFSSTFTIPANGTSGTRRLRVYTVYPWWYISPNDPCSDNYYGTYLDFDVTAQYIIQNDAGITSIISPTDAFDSYQPQDFVVTLKNFSENTLTNCRINWTIDGVTQTPINWSGSLAENATENITLTSGLNYTPQAPWNPLHFEAWTSNLTGTNIEANSYPDANSNNDRIVADIQPILNDAGFLNADQMIPIFAGMNDVKLTIKNYAPKPLSSVTINWKVEGVEQTPFLATFEPPVGPGEEVTVIVGTYFFGAGNQGYLIEASTSDPNGVADENPNNDAGASEVYKALPGGTYTIGAYQSDFVSVQEAVEFINFWGIGGPVTFLIRPGEYASGVKLEPNTRRQFPLTFESITRRAFDVIIYNDGADGFNYTFGLFGYDDIIFRSLTFESRNSYYPNLFEFNIGNDNILFDNCVFNGQSQVGNLINILGEIENFEVMNCIFNNGFIHIYSVNEYNNLIWIHDNEFNYAGLAAVALNDFGWNRIDNLTIDNNIINGSGGWLGVFLIYASNTSVIGNRFNGIDDRAAIFMVGNSNVNNIVQSYNIISNNTISSTNSDGIYYEGDFVKIEDNVISGVGNSIDFHSGIRVVGYGSSIDNNKITVSGQNGIYISGEQNETTYNDIDAESDGYMRLAGIMTENLIYSTIADNEMSTSNQFGLFNLNSMHVNAYYNSVLGRSSWPSFGFENSDTGGESTAVFVQKPIVGQKIKALYEIADNKSKSEIELGEGPQSNEYIRNIFQNIGNGPAGYIVDDFFSISSDGNNWWTNGTLLVDYNYSGYATLGDYQSASGQDLNSSSVEAKFLAADDLRLTHVDDMLYYTQQMFWDNRFEEIEKTDLGGVERTKTFYKGAHSMVPVIEMANEPEDVVDCFGTTEHTFVVVANVDFNAVLSYQWYKDNLEIFGATGPILYINQPMDYEMNAVYQCKIMANGEAEPIWSRPALLYTMRPTEITRQPDNVRNDLGDVSTFEIDMHIYNEAPALYQPDIQWYRAGQMIADNDRIAGSKASIMTIRDLQPEDYGDDYFVIISGLCGKDTSVMISLSEVPKLSVEDIEGTVTICDGDDVSWTVNATTNVPGVEIKYNWIKDALYLVDDGKISGSQTANLTITGATAADAGEYSCHVSIDNWDEVYTNMSTLNVNSSPAIITDLEPMVSVQTGKDLVLTIDADGQDLTYQWYFNGTEITGETNATLTKTNMQTADEGNYKVKVMNVCGEVSSNECAVTVTPFFLLDLEGQAGEYILNQNTPNPFAGATVIGFILPEASHAKLAITDVYGRELAVVADKGMPAGLSQFTINSNEMNLTSGVYFYTLTVNGKSITKTMVIVK